MCFREAEESGLLTLSIQLVQLLLAQVSLLMMSHVTSCNFEYTSDDRTTSGTLVNCFTDGLLESRTNIHS